MDSVQPIEHRTYLRRYALLALISTAMFIVVFQLQAYTAIANVIIKFYNKSYQSVNSLSIIHNVVAILFFFPIGKFVEKSGLKLSVLVATLINALGSIVKCFSNKSSMFILIVVGQVLVSASRLTILACVPILISAWFKPEEASNAFGIFNALWSCGSTAAFFLPSIVADVTLTTSQTRITLLVIAGTAAVISSLLFIICCLVFKEKPSTPPSLAEEKRMDNDNRFKLVTFLKNKNAVLICTCHSLSAGIIEVVNATLNQSVMSSFQNSNTLSVAGILLSISGIPASILIGIFIKKYPKYKRHQLLLAVIILFSCAIYVLGLWMKSSVCLFVSTFLIGYTVVASLVLLMDYLVEVTYPIRESVSFVIMVTVSMVPGIAFIPIVTFLETKYGATIANFVLIPISVLNLILSSFICEDLRRRKANEETRPLLNEANSPVTIYH